METLQNSTTSNDNKNNSQNNSTQQISTKPRNEVNNANEDTMNTTSTNNSNDKENDNSQVEENSTCSMSELPNEFDPSYPQCYCGGTRSLGSIELQCWFCVKWFHAECVGLTTGVRLPFLTNYQFNCKNCTANKQETFTMKSASFSQICHTALSNLTYQERADGGSEVIFSKDREIIPFIEKHWEQLTTAPRRVKLTWHTTVHKTLLKDTDLFVVNEPTPGDLCFSLFNQDLFKVGPSLEALRGTYISAQSSKLNQLDTKGRSTKRKTPFDNQQLTTKTKKSDVGTAVKLSIHGYPLEHPFNKDGYRYVLAEPDPHAPNRQAFDESIDWAGKPIPGYLYRMFQASKVLLALHDRAPQLKVGEDRLTVTGEKGYSMIRATHGIRSGSWYFEVHLQDVPQDAACRIGWSQTLGNSQAPLGYDKFGYSWRSRKGTIFHQSRGKHYSDSYGEGDVVGFFIHIPSSSASSKLLPYTYKDRPLVKFKNNLYFEEKDYVTETEKNLKPCVNGKMIMVKNGKSQGVAFADFFDGIYYPAFSLYKSITLSVNFGPDFKYPPKDIPEYKPVSQAAEEAILEYSLADIIYCVENKDNLPTFT